MMCDRCGKRPATIHLYQRVNGRQVEQNLCSTCYAELQGINRNRQGREGREYNLNSYNDPFGFNDFDEIFRQFNSGSPYNSRSGQSRGQQGVPNYGSGQTPPPTNDGRGGVLGEYGINLTELAREGKIDRVIGRDKEIERVIEILNRRQKNNPVLVGEAGVGKTAIVEGLANKIVDGEVPEKLKNKEIISLDVSSLVSGTGIRGQFEERMQELVKELKEDDNVILFIDEIHQIVGAGTAEGSNMDAGNILKPAIARGDIQLIGATTFDEYRVIEKDSALERRFQPVVVKEPSVEATLEILKGIKPTYEKYHNVKYTDEAVEAAVLLSDRYIQDRQLPDKAIDLLDESGAKKNLTIQTVDPETIKNNIQEAEQKKEEATRLEDFEQAAFYRDQIKKYEDMLENQVSEEDQPVVDVEDITHIIETQTGIPVSELQEKEQEQLRNLDEEMKAEVVGQDEAIDKVVRAIQRSRVGLQRPGKPIGSFLFVGPTGVGKTETAKVLAEKVFGTRESMIRLDMSEFMDKHSTSKLIGSPPGYVGYDEAGQLTEAVRRNPYSLILVDEVEKAHPDVLNIFLQIMDDGRLTDAQGRVVSFENTIIIMTSNAGSRGAEASVGFGAQNEGRQQSIKDQLTDYFTPEFLNRFTAIVEFKPLTKEDLLEIVDLMLEDVNDLLANQDISIQVSPAAKEELVELGYNPAMGARPLRRVIEEEIEDKIADYYLNHENVSDLYAILVDGEIVVTDDPSAADDSSESKDEDTEEKASETNDEESHEDKEETEE